MSMEIETNNFLENGIKIIIDTCIFNHLFSDNIDIGSEILGLLSLYKDNVWIPYTVYNEFSIVDINDLIEKKVNEYKGVGGKLSNEYNKFYQEIEKIYMNVQNKKYEEWNIIKSTLNEKCEEIIQIINTHKKNISLDQYKINVETHFRETQKFIEELRINGQVGNKFSTSQIIEICKEGEIRYEHLLPPGYSDVGKKGIEKYNDLFIWKEIIKYSQDNNVENIIFLTNDCKEGNWYSPDKGERKVIHEFLKSEFEENNKNSTNISFMTLIQFLEHCKNSFNIETCLRLEEDEQVEKILEMYNSKICDELYGYVINMNYTDISNEFYLNNDGEIYYDELVSCSHSMEIMDKEILYKINVQLPFDLIIANEDNEGDRFIYGEASILVSAIVEISQKFIKSDMTGKYTIITPLESQSNEFCVSISHKVTSVKDPYDYYA